VPSGDLAMAGSASRFSIFSPPTRSSTESSGLNPTLRFLFLKELFSRDQTFLFSFFSEHVTQIHILFEQKDEINLSKISEIINIIF
jgi:hypothetical protein